MSTPLTLRAAFGAPYSTASVKDSVLILVDIQKEYASGPIAVPNFATSSVAIAALLARYRAEGGDLIHIQHKGNDYPSAQIFRNRSGKETIWEGVAPAESEKLVIKEQASAFFGTNLDELIKATGKKQLVVVGYLINNCINYTVGEAAARGYDVIVPKDCVGGRPLPGQEDAEVLLKSFLAGFGDAAATVIESKDIL